MDFRITQKQFQKVLDDVKKLKGENAELRKLHEKKAETTEEKKTGGESTEDASSKKEPPKRRRILDLFRRHKQEEK